MRVLSCSSSVAYFRTSALFYCSQSLVFVLVAWCRTFHEQVRVCAIPSLPSVHCGAGCYSFSSLLHSDVHGITEHVKRSHGSSFKLGRGGQGSSGPVCQ